MGVQPRRQVPCTMSWVPTRPRPLLEDWFPTASAFPDGSHPLIVGIDWSSEEMDRRRAWQAYLMGFAVHAATKSKDSTKVGAILVDDDNSVLLTGYNGPPRGVQDLPERRSRENGVKYLYAVHAEINVLALAAKKGIRTDGLTLFTTHMCCAACARAMIQAGIRKVVYGPGKTSMPAEEFEAANTMFLEASVELEPFNG